MRLPQLRMESQFIKLGIQIQKPVQQIQQPKPVQRIEQPKAEMNIETTPGRLNIDQSQARAEVGIQPTDQMVKEQANLAKQKAMEGIARRVRQGDELMRIENGGNPIKSQAIENGNRPYYPLGIGWIPSYGSVKLYYEPAQVNIDVTPQKPIIDIRAQKPIHEYIPGNVSYYIAQKNFLKIEVVNIVDEQV